MKREAAIELLKKSIRWFRHETSLEEEWTESMNMAIKALEELPKRRKEAKRWKRKALQAESTVGEDCISRQEAIHHVCVECEPIIRSLSPAKKKGIEALQAEPVKHGEWIVYEMHTTQYGKVGFECSVCGVPYKLEHRLGADVGWNYCPCCGAKMDGGV